MIAEIVRRLMSIGMTCATVVVTAGVALAQTPGPRIATLDPPGARRGTTLNVQVKGSGLEGLASLHFDEPRIEAVASGVDRFQVKIPNDLPPGQYEVRALGANGLSAPRPFFVTPRPVVLESQAQGATEQAQAVPLDVSIAGRIEAAGDVDTYRFRARAGQRVVLEGWAERLDSKLRAVVELDDDQGRRLAASRGYHGLDPLIEFRVPTDGEYVARVYDLTYTGGPEHAYRLDIDTGPRVELAWPDVVERGKPTRVALLGRNLTKLPDVSSLLEARDVDANPPPGGLSASPRAYSRAFRFALEEFALDFPDAPAPAIVGISDVPVVLDAADHQRPETAQPLAWPCEISGRLEQGDEKDWYRIDVQRGEVLWFELFGERLGAPTDLDFSILDASGRRELLHLSDRHEDPRSGNVWTGHSDPSGRWVAPAKGRYLLVVRNLIGGSHRDPRRMYRLSVRREEAEFQLLAVPSGGGDAGGWNVPRGGRAWVELLALRRRGMNQPIRVSAADLPSGWECPDVWIGPGVDRAPLVFSAGLDASREPKAIRLVGRADLGGTELLREARIAVVVSSDSALPVSRLTSQFWAATGPESACIVTATPSRSAVSQGSVVDVSTRVDPLPGWRVESAAFTGVGIPAAEGEKVGVDPSDTARAWFCVQVPERIEPGPYSFAIRAVVKLTAPPEKPGAKPRSLSVSTLSNPVTIEVAPGAMDLRIDPRTPRAIKRGEIIQLYYQAARRNGFIGKIHTELFAPEGVIGLRGRGVTFVGQTETGEIQIVASDDAPLGRQPTLRLDAVGTVEDEPIHHAGCFIDLEITR